ncbi:MAG: winged helix-turn-helix transcriptional regulator [Candidatus Heimdallarchaeaceae archaeon]
MNTMTITYEEYILLGILNANPTATYADLARHFDTSIHTIKRRILKLKEKGLYRGYYAVYNPTALGLQRFFIFIYLDSVKQYSLIERALDKHPYTIHRTRFYSPQLGVFAQFDYPSKDPKLLAKFFSHLRDIGIISAYTIIRSSGVSIRKPPDFQRFQWNTLVWSYDWEDFNEYIHSTNPLPLPPLRRNILALLKPIDLDILRKLTYNAEINQRELSRQMNINRTTIWRRINFLQEFVIDGYNAKISRSKFNLTANALILISYHKLKYMLSVFHALSQQAVRPPFRYHVELAESAERPHMMILYLSIPPHHEAQLIYTLSDLASYQIYNLDVSGDHSIRYAFYPGNFDWQNNKWKDEPDYVLKEPLAFISELK